MADSLFQMVFAGPPVGARPVVDAFVAAGYPARVDNVGNSGFLATDTEAFVEVLGDGELDHPQQLGRLHGFELRMHGRVDPMPGGWETPS